MCTTHSHLCSYTSTRTAVCTPSSVTLQPGPSLSGSLLEMPELKLGKEALSSSQITPQLRLKQHQCMLSLFSSAFLFNFTSCFSSFLFHVHLHACIHMYICHLPCICITSLLSLFLFSATCAQTAIPYLSLTVCLVFISCFSFPIRSSYFFLFVPLCIYIFRLGMPPIKALLSLLTSAML